jgi:hypothetical protein
MSQRRNRNVLDVEEGISDFRTPVHIERTGRRTSKPSAWVSMVYIYSVGFRCNYDLIR